MNRNLDKCPSISNTVIRKTSSLVSSDDPALLSQIRRFLSSRNKRSLSDDMNFQLRKLPNKMPNQAKTVINPSNNNRPFLLKYDTNF